MRYALILFFFIISAVAAQQTPVSPAQLQQQAEARQAEIDNRQGLRGFQPSENPSSSSFEVLPVSPDETPCLPIQYVALEGDQNQRFAVYLRKTLDKMALHPRRNSNVQFHISHAGQPSCLDATMIERMSEETQNAIIDAGWITTRIIVADQDLNNGILTLTALAGYAGNKHFSDHTSGQRTPALFNTIPIKHGELLSLRDVEQGLENLRRLPNVQANIDIVPGNVQGQSDLQISWQQERWYRFNFSMDDSGSKATGKYMGTLGVSLDNPLRLSDSLSLNYSRNLLPGQRQTSLTGHSGRGWTDNYSLNYSVPLGYWEIDLGSNRYYYDQAVAGQTLTYHYQGISTQHQANLNRTIYRDAHSKLDVNAGIWQKTNKSFVDDSEISVQRRRQGGWQAGLRHVFYFQLGSLQSSLNFKKGTGAFSALPAPEAALGEGTSRFIIWTADINWQQPFTWSEQTFIWNSRLHGQWTDNRLTPVDRMSIGGRYNVRGFNGEITLSGDKGWYLRNDLQWRYRPNHAVYFALDGGGVSGPSTRNLPGRNLVGTALGVRGQWDMHGKWNYDAFIGTSLYQPKGMNANKFIGGFSIHYSY